MEDTKYDLEMHTSESDIPAGVSVAEVCSFVIDNCLKDVRHALHAKIRVSKNGVVSQVRSSLLNVLEKGQAMKRISYEIPHHTSHPYYGPRTFSRHIADEVCKNLLIAASMFAPPFKVAVKMLREEIAIIHEQIRSALYKSLSKQEATPSSETESVETMMHEIEQTRNPTRYDVYEIVGGDAYDLDILGFLLEIDDAKEVATDIEGKYFAIEIPLDKISMAELREVSRKFAIEMYMTLHFHSDLIKGVQLEVLPSDDDRLLDFQKRYALFIAALLAKLNQIWSLDITAERLGPLHPDEHIAPLLQEIIEPLRDKKQCSNMYVLFFEIANLIALTLRFGCSEFYQAELAELARIWESNIQMLRDNHPIRKRSFAQIVQLARTLANVPSIIPRQQKHTPAITSIERMDAFLSNFCEQIATDLYDEIPSIEFYTSEEDGICVTIKQNKPIFS